MLASTLFLFFACLANAVAFGALTGAVTGGEIGTVEMIAATAVGGIVFMIFSGQLTILGTGPIVIFTGLLYQVCASYEIDFLATYAWVGIWSALFMVLLAVFNVSALMRYFTHFTDEIFAALIAVIFIVEAVKSMVTPFTVSDDAFEADVALLTLILGMGTFLLARNFKAFGRGFIPTKWSAAWSLTLDLPYDCCHVAVCIPIRRNPGAAKDANLRRRRDAPGWWIF